MNASTEDYLKHIYGIRQTSGKVSTSVLAEKLGVTQAAVSEMIGRLDKLGFVRNERYKGFDLTKKGEAIALNLVRKHRLWEVFLAEHLHYPWEQVHEEAEKLEHSSSDELIARLEEFLGNPKFDPHGHPIPDRKGNIAKATTLLVAQVPEGARCAVVSVSDEDPSLLIHLARVGIRIGEEFVVTDHISFDNSVVLEHRGRDRTLSSAMASSILVTIVKPESA